MLPRTPVDADDPERQTDIKIADSSVTLRAARVAKAKEHKGRHPSVCLRTAWGNHNSLHLLALSIGKRSTKCLSCSVWFSPHLEGKGGSIYREAAVCARVCDLHNAWISFSDGLLGRGILLPLYPEWNSVSWEVRYSEPLVSLGHLFQDQNLRMLKSLL